MSKTTTKKVTKAIKSAKETMKEGLHITLNHTGKMRWMQSLSTSCILNGNCAKYAKIKGSICEKCYAQRQLRTYTTMQPCLERNTKLLTESILPKEELPLVNACFFRFEAFGDLINENQVINYFNICKVNPYTHFALWTKNPHIIAKALENTKKPKNLQIIWSSLLIDKTVPLDVLQKKYPFIDKTFTVYSKKAIKEGNVEINCGAKNCFKCHKCYLKNNETVINEKLK